MWGEDCQALRRRWKCRRVQSAKPFQDMNYLDAQVTFLPERLRTLALQADEYSDLQDTGCCFTYGPYKTDTLQKKAELVQKSAIYCLSLSMSFMAPVCIVESHHCRWPFSSTQ